MTGDVIPNGIEEQIPLDISENIPYDIFIVSENAREMERPIEKAVRVAGGQTALAEALGTRQAIVWKWINNRKSPAPPAEYCLAIERITAEMGDIVDRFDLRPDVYGMRPGNWISPFLTGSAGSCVRNKPPGPQPRLPAPLSREANQKNEDKAHGATATAARIGAAVLIEGSAEAQGMACPSA